MNVEQIVGGRTEKDKGLTQETQRKNTESTEKRKSIGRRACATGVR